MWQRRWWDDRLLDWSMRDEQLKVQLFRFVDVLPMLKTPEAVMEHLHEYLGPGARQAARQRSTWRWASPGECRSRGPPWPAPRG